MVWDFCCYYYYYYSIASLEDGSEAPHFLKELTSITVVEGSAARFETCARGQPAPTVRWLKDGKPLLTDGIRLCVSQTSTERSGTNTSSHTLLVKDAIPRDSGTYTCIATSSSGTAITEAALHVRGKLISFNLILVKPFSLYCYS